MTRDWNLIVEDIAIIVVVFGILGSPLWGLIYTTIDYFFA